MRNTEIRVVRDGVLVWQAIIAPGTATQPPAAVQRIIEMPGTVVEQRLIEETPVTQDLTTSTRLRTLADDVEEEIGSIEAQFLRDLATELALAEMERAPLIVPNDEGSRYEVWDKFGRTLEEQFPGQCADDLAMAICYNGAGDSPDVVVTKLVCLQEGANDETDWHWYITFADGSSWFVHGGCDYTGWDCQSSLTWERK